MINGRFHVNLKWHGINLLVDAAVVGKRYEIMAFDDHGTDYDCVIVKTLDEVEDAFWRMVRKFSYEPAVLTGRYAKLRDDLKDALEVGKAVEDSAGKDYGTCNFDGTGVYLIRWNHDLVRQAAKEAGTYAHGWEIGSGWWVFSPVTHSQGNPRTMNAEAVTASMGNKGYKVLGYYQMD